MVIGPQIWGRGGEDELRKVFSAITRMGLGTHFGGSSIAHYQAVQVAAIEELERRAVERGVIEDARSQSFEVRTRQGDVEARLRRGDTETSRLGSRHSRWTLLGSVHEVSRAAYDRSYRR